MNEAKVCWFCLSQEYNFDRDEWEKYYDDWECGDCGMYLCGFCDINHPDLAEIYFCIYEICSGSGEDICFKHHDLPDL